MSWTPLSCRRFLPPFTFFPVYTVLLFGSLYVSSSSSLSLFFFLPLCLFSLSPSLVSLVLSLPLSLLSLCPLLCCLVETLMARYKSFPPWALTWLLCFCTVFLYDKFVYGKKRRKRKKNHLMTSPNWPAAQKGSKQPASCNKSQSL